MQEHVKNRGNVAAEQVLALLYHELRPEPTSYSYVMPCDTFADHLRLFSSGGLAPQSLAPLLTFDDGHLSNYEYALPLLQQHGQSASFFITAGWTGQRSNYMRAEHLRALHAAKQQIGAHGWSHTLLTTCSPDQLRRELVDTKNLLEDTLSAPVTDLSLPGGRANAAVYRACYEAGYTKVWTSVPRAERLPFGTTVGRLNLLSSATSTYLRAMLDRRSGMLRTMERKYLLKSALQQLLGDRMYARLWAMVNHEETPEAESTASGSIRESAH